MENISTSYKTYKQEQSKPVDIKTYRKLCETYIKFLMQKVKSGHEVSLPSRLGTLKILGKKIKISFDENGNPKGLAPDWVATKKLRAEDPEAARKRTVLYHLNAHTDGIRYKYHWSKSQVFVENKTLYSLRLTRENKRAVHERIMAGVEYQNV